MDINLDFSAAVPDVAAIGEDLLVPFTARRLKAPAMLWLNKRWFFEQGIDAFDAATAQALEGALLREYAFCVPQAHDPEEAFLPEERVFMADRYAGEGVVFNGGSGRVGAYGQIQVKGIGRTPLSSDETDFFHSHGGASLEEAIRETVFSEVIGKEFPHGGEPVLAVILTGTFTQWKTDDGIVPERRALILRPAFVRPAIFERALYFRKSRFSHLPDVARVKQSVRWYLERGHQTYGSMRAFGERIARQVAFGVVHRLTHSAYSSSNMTLNGALADYGATAALPGWGQYSCVKGFPAFGKEIELVAKALSAISYYIAKYGGPEGVQIAQLGEVPPAVSNSYREGMESELLRVCGVPEEVKDTPPARTLLAQLRDYFLAQQKHVSDIYLGTPEPRNGWLYSDLFDHSGALRQTPHARVDAIRQSLEALYATLYPEAPSQGWITLARYLRPRTGLFRQELKGRIDALLVNGGLSNAELRPAIEQMIRDTVAGSRRHWPVLPPGHIVLGQGGADDGNVLYCETQETRQRVLVLEGFLAEGVFRCLGARIPVGDLKGLSCARYLAGRVLIVPAPDHAWDGSFFVRVAGHQLLVPPLACLYRAEVASASAA